MSLKDSLEVGDYVLDFHGETDINPRFYFSTVAGRWIILSFFGSLADPRAMAAQEAVMARRQRFDDTDRAYFGVSTDPDDRAFRGLKASPPGLRYFYDHDHAITRLFGVEDENGFQPRAYLLDRALRVVDIQPIERMPVLLDTLDTCLKAEAGSPAAWLAPVLTVPRVFEPELCQQLIDYYEARGGTLSGVMREKDGLTVGVHDNRVKRRRDAAIEDKALRELTRDRIARRLLPSIWRAFHWQATRIERYMVACYEGQDRGFFNPHRDNTTAGTAHRVFAVTLNLNSDYEGGELRFPEFGHTTYKPPPGGATVFNCSILHEATPVTSGIRYAFVPFLYDDEHAAIRTANHAKVVPQPIIPDPAKESQSAE